MKSLTYAIALIFVTIGITNSSFARQAPNDCNCSVALAKDIFKVKRSTISEYAYIQTITKDDFELHKSGGSFEGGYLYDLITGSFDWSDFKLKRSSLLSDAALEWSYADALEEFRAVTSDTAYEAFNKCNVICSRGEIGFYAWKVHENKELIDIDMYFNAPPGTKQVDLTFELTNCKPRKRIPREIERNETLSLTFDRIDSAAEVIIAINARYPNPPRIISKWMPKPSEGMIELKVYKPAMDTIPQTIYRESPDRHNKGKYTNKWTVPELHGYLIGDIDGPHYVGPTAKIERMLKALEAKGGHLATLAKAGRRAYKKVGEYKSLKGIAYARTRRNAVISFVTSSRAARWKINVVYEKETTIEDTGLNRTFPFRVGKSFTINLPTTRTGVMIVSLDGNTIPVEIGKPTATDATIQMLEPVFGDYENHYPYIVKGAVDVLSDHSILSSLLSTIDPVASTRPVELSIPMGQPREYAAYAPPAYLDKWGIWTRIAEHTGRAGFHITAEPVGSTVITGQVRYYKTDSEQHTEGFTTEITIQTANVVAAVEVRFKGWPLGTAVKGTVFP